MQIPQALTEHNAQEKQKEYYQLRESEAKKAFSKFGQLFHIRYNRVNLFYLILFIKFFLKEDCFQRSRSTISKQLMIKLLHMIILALKNMQLRLSPFIQSLQENIFAHLWNQELQMNSLKAMLKNLNKEFFFKYQKMSTLFNIEKTRFNISNIFIRNKIIYQLGFFELKLKMLLQTEFNILLDSQKSYKYFKPKDNLFSFLYRTRISIQHKKGEQ
ncbi:unnamed protein product [Paramecium sonneborni]|uniref:Uncharacterized protein n=1 Tax=Paramecium sonneborni TaxID=65129 RepID=A0A8S1R237_9CILI|nr:unnamed protein product [Paramecium sonneborni]